MICILFIGLTMWLTTLITIYTIDHYSQLISHTTSFDTWTVFKILGLWMIEESMRGIPITSINQPEKNGMIQMDFDGFWWGDPQKNTSHHRWLRLVDFWEARGPPENCEAPPAQLQLQARVRVLLWFHGGFMGFWSVIISHFKWD